MSKNVVAILRIVIQALIWLSFLFIIPLGWQMTPPIQFWIKQGVLMVVLLTAYYTNSSQFVPRLLLKNRMAWFLGAIVSSIIFILIAMRVVELGLNLPELMFKTHNPHKSYVPSGWFRFDFFTFTTALLVFGISTSIALIRNRNKEEESRKASEQQRIIIELASLKSQINPHFFFNTLNTIYALTGSNVELAQRTIHMLSKMMRYVLYETQKGEVLLSHELTFVENYIELMKLRLTDKVNIIYTKPEPVNEVFVAPMILMPFVENAFKHGISPNQPSTLEIDVSQVGSNLKITVKNEVFKVKGLDIEKSSGIGLSNTKRRLELLYPNRHTLQISEYESKYQVELILSLSFEK